MSTLNTTLSKFISYPFTNPSITPPPTSLLNIDCYPQPLPRYHEGGPSALPNVGRVYMSHEKREKSDAMSDQEEVKVPSYVWRVEGAKLVWDPPLLALRHHHSKPETI